MDAQHKELDRHLPLLEDAYHHSLRGDLKAAVRMIMITLEFSKGNTPEDKIRRSKCLYWLFKLRLQWFTFTQDTHLLKDAYKDYVAFRALSEDPSIDIPCCMIELMESLWKTFSGDFVHGVQDLKKLLENENCLPSIKIQSIYLLSDWYMLFDIQFEKAQKYIDVAFDIMYNHQEVDTFIYWRSRIFKQAAWLATEKKDWAKALEFSQYLKQLATREGDLEMLGYCDFIVGKISCLQRNHEIGIPKLLDALKIFQKIGHNVLSQMVEWNIAKMYQKTLSPNLAFPIYQSIIKNHIFAPLKEHIVFSKMGHCLYEMEQESEAISFLEKIEDIYRRPIDNWLLRYLYAKKQETLPVFPNEKILADKAWYSLPECWLSYHNDSTLPTLPTQLVEAEMNVSLLKDMYYLSYLIAKKQGNHLNALENFEDYSLVKNKILATRHDFLALGIVEKYHKNSQIQFKKEVEKIEALRTVQSKQNDQISKQNRSLREANDDLKQLAYVVSHDFREPVRMISAFGRILQGKLEDKMTLEEQKYFNFILGGANRLQLLLEDLFKYAALQVSTPEETPLGKIALEVKQNIGHLLAQSEGTITVMPLPTVYVSASMAYQLLQNLLTNALKFRHPNRKPMVKLWSQIMEDGIILHVQDNGIGIDEAHYQRIFSIFQRLHPQDQFEGSGIGLAICQKIVNHWGGNITVTSVPNKGTDFQIFIPQGKKTKNLPLFEEEGIRLFPEVE